MKKSNRPKIMIAAAVGALALTSLVAQPSGIHKHGTDILHFFVRAAMINEGVESGADGRVDAKQNQQGNANNQRLDILVQGLATNTTYQLLALLGDDTNLTTVTDFTTDDRGRAGLRYRRMGNGNGNGGGLGHGKSLLPNALNPISNIRELSVFNSNTQAVFTADLTDPLKLQYLVKRDLSSGSVDALLRIKATTQRAQFELRASGLNPTNDYLLVLNGEIVQTNGTDADGHLRILTPLQIPTQILDLRTVALWDSVSNVVLSTTLP